MVILFTVNNSISFKLFLIPNVLTSIGIQIVQISVTAAKLWGMICYQKYKQ